MVIIKIDKSKLNNYEEKSAFVSFKYDMELVELMRSLPIRFYHKDTKEWEVPIDKIEYIKSQVPHKTVKIIGNLNENNNDSNYIPKGFSFKTEPFSHQIDGFKYGLCHNKWLLGDEQGLGKTKQVIDIATAKKLQHNYKHCLIICCVNSLKWNWFNEVNTHSNELPYILGMRYKKGKWSVKGNKEKLEDLKLLHLNRSYFIITNVESLRVPEISNEINKLCKENQINMIAVDEIHKCFDYDTLICTNKGNLKIGDIVSNKLDVNVLSYNTNTNKQEYKKIKNWFENLIAEPFIELIIQTNKGIKKIRCTGNHKFYTINRGWVCAKDLTQDDNLIENSLYIF